MTKGKTPIYNYEDSLLFPGLDTFFGNRLTKVYYLTMGLMLLFGFLLFDLRLSLGGDDSDYIIAARDLLSGKAFPTFHGSLYVVFLAQVIKIFGLHLFWLKLFSLVFLVISHSLLYKALKHRISPFILSGILVFNSINSSILYYGSHTYTEAFFMGFQSLFILMMLLILADDRKTLRKEFFFGLTLGFAVFMMAGSRNIGIAALITAGVLLAYCRNWRALAFTILSFFVFRLPFSIYRSVVWQADGGELGNQLRVMLQKDPYNAALGSENFAGLITRFFANFANYLGNIFIHLTLGFENGTGWSYIFGVVLLMVFIVGWLYAFRERNKVMLLLYFYLSVSLPVMFLVLSREWSQPRLLIPYLILIMVVIVWSLARLGKQTGKPVLRYLAVGFLLVSIVTTIPGSLYDASESRSVMKKLMKGEKFAGYTPDIQNFLAASAWSSKNTPDSVRIASRKAAMSSLYGEGRDFYPIFKLPFKETRDVFLFLDSNSGSYYIINEDSLLGKPEKPVLLMKQSLYGLIASDNAVYGIYLNEKGVQTDSLLNVLRVKSFNSFEKFISKTLAKPEASAVLIPDEMLKELATNNVHYVIRASIRVNQSEKTDQTINTISRYMSAIDTKYPGIFQPVRAFGKPDEEPAILYRINYPEKNK